MPKKKPDKKTGKKKAVKPGKKSKIKSLNINVPVLARVEGEGALELSIENGAIAELKLKIFEPPRLFEKLLEGRHYQELPDMVARICGICPVAYQMSAILAAEHLFTCKVTPWIKAMRRLYYCGEWIQSHALHIHLLALPDFFQVNNAIELSALHPDEVSRGMKLQALGNNIIKLFGARSVNPVGVKVGGFTHAPQARQVESLLSELNHTENDAKQLLDWLCDFPLPDFKDKGLQFSLHENDNYPIMARQLLSNKEDSLSIDDYESAFQEQQLPYTTAFHSFYKQRHYLVGPLARFNINRQQLHPDVQAILKKHGYTSALKNNYFAIIARAAEIYQALLEAKHLLANYRVPDSPYVEVKPRAGIAIGASEAPRGLLWHRYEFDDKGLVRSAKIVPPTSQNQAQIEDDIRQTLTTTGLDQDDDQLRHMAEQVIRNYDPCISCATHFLSMDVKRL